MSLPSAHVSQGSVDQPEAKKTSGRAEHPVDIQFKRLQDKVLPESPYILSTKTTYCLEPQYRDFWRNGTLFDRDEEELQFLTFKDRSHDLMPGFYCRGGWDDGKGKIAPPEEPYSRTSSDGTPRHGQAPKKKISLADYNKRDRTKAAVTASKPTSPKPKVDKIGDEKVTQPRVIAIATKPQQTEQHGQKRSVETIASAKNSTASEHFPASPPHKKLRVTPEPPNATSKEPSKLPPPKPIPQKNRTKKLSSARKTMSSEDLKRDKPAVHRSSHQNTIAPREQQTEKATMHGLPPMLSPTLPSDIEEELAKLTPNVRRRSVSVSKIKSPSASSLNKHRISGRVDSSTDDERVKPGREGKLNAPLKPTILASSNPLKQQQGQAHVTSAPRQVLKDSGPEKSTATKANGFAKPVAAVHANPVPTPPRSEKLRLRLRLQIKKKTNRKNLAQYLRLPPTPGKYPTFLRTMEQEYRSRTPQSERKYSGTAREHRIDEKPTVKRNFVEATQTGEKRRRSQDERDRQELPVKRHKTPGWLPQKPHTPKQSSISSPAPPNVGSAQKPQLPTPRADPKSIPAQPIESDQGALPTPQASTLNITSNGPETAHRRRSFASVGDFPTTLKHWKPESSKYFELGKTLKHDSDAFLKRSPTKTVDDCKKGVVIAIESILCFMLAFTLMDEPYREHRVPCDLSAWRTMLPFMENVAEAAGEFQLLLGLLYQLEAVIQDIMVHYDLKRLDCNPLKYSVPEDAASDPIKTEEKARAATYHKDFSRFHTQFVEGQKKWRSGWMMLGCKEMEEKFPQTWAKREQEFLAVGKSAEAITKGEYQRTVNLPMSSMTSGLQAVNFGLSILAEWTSNHGVEWQPKLVL